MADERIFGDFDTLSDRIPPYENAYYVVVTRGHLGDSACARAILKRPFAYFGMIGSRTKVRITREKLLKEGFTEEQLDQIHAPIGLPIGGQMRLRSREHHGRDRAGKEPAFPHLL